VATWNEIKQDARRAVHTTFGRSATYAVPNSASVAVDVRLHDGTELFGDLDREGYARTVETVTQLVFMRDQIIPVKGAVVTFADDGSSYRISAVWPPEGPLEQICEVVKL
jgi:hypothetical protein